MAHVTIYMKKTKSQSESAAILLFKKNTTHCTPAIGKNAFFEEFAGLPTLNIRGLGGRMAIMEEEGWKYDENIP